MKIDEFSTTGLAADLDATERVRFVCFGFDMASGAPIPVVVPIVNTGAGYTPRRDWLPWHEAPKPKKKRRKKKAAAAVPVPRKVPVAIPRTAYRDFLKRIAEVKRQAPELPEIRPALAKIAAVREPAVTPEQERAIIKAARNAVDEAEIALLELIS